jgi:hypothetical protein
MAYDRAAIEQRGLDAFTNFHLVEYTEYLASDQLAVAMQRGLITDADLLLREQMLTGSAGIPASAAEPAEEADPGTSGAMDGVEEQGAAQSSPEDWPAWAAAAAAAAGDAPAGLDASTSAAASPASLGGEASAEHLALQLFECILQEGVESPQSVLPTTQRTWKAKPEGSATPGGTPACGGSLNAAAAAMSPDARQELGPFLDQLRAFAA